MIFYKPHDFKKKCIKTKKMLVKSKVLKCYWNTFKESIHSLIVGEDKTRQDNQAKQTMIIFGTIIIMVKDTRSKSRSHGTR